MRMCRWLGIGRECSTEVGDNEVRRWVSEVVGLGTNGLLVDDWIRGRSDGYGAWSLRRSVG
jgi:hypothetical protein